MHPKIDTKIDTGNVKNKHEKSPNNGASIGPQIDGISNCLPNGDFAKMLFLPWENQCLSSKINETFRKPRFELKNET